MGCCQSQEDEPLLQLDGHYDTAEYPHVPAPPLNSPLDRPPSPYILAADRIVV